MTKDDFKSTAPLAGVIAAVVVVLGLGVAMFKSHHDASPAKVAAGVAVNVSLIQLIATPEKFDGRHVFVTGFLVNESGDRALYLSANDAINGLGNKIEVSFQGSPVPAGLQDGLNREYVALRGSFHDGSVPGIAGIDHLEERRGTSAPPPLGQ